MKKNNGFIATSLLYSFFLVFCALLVGLIGTVLHNRTLLSNVIDNIKTDLAEIDQKTFKKVEVGNYVKIPVFSSGVKINTENVKWVVASKNTSNKTITLVSDNIVIMSNNYKTAAILQDNMNQYFNLYTAGSASLNYMTYLTKAQISNFEAITDLTVRKSLLSVETEYIYYDSSTNAFYLYKYTCNQNNVCSVNKNQKIATTDTKQYGLRFVMTVSDNTPIASGIGTINDPYNVLYYIHKTDKGDVLKLHYDNINPNGNLGFKTGLNIIKDLSGNNIDGVLQSGTYSNNINTGATIPSPLTSLLNTNLNIHSLVNSTNGYTIEFRALNYLRLSAYPTYPNNFITLSNNGTLILISTSYSTRLLSGSFNTFTIVRKPGTTYLSVYINGKPISASITITTLPAAANNLLYIGGTGQQEVFKSIRIYNTALTEPEIMHNYKVDERWRII